MPPLPVVVTLILPLALGAAVAACGNTTLDVFDADRGLVAHWALDETEPSAVVVDSSGHGHDGTPSTNPPTPSPAVPPVHFPNARSRAFNGRDQLLEFANVTDLDFSGVMTLCAWINPVAVDDYRDIVAHGYHWTPDAEVALRIHGGRYEMLGWDGIDHLVAVAVPASDVGTWIHLCGVYDGTTYILFRNGTQVGTAEDTFAPPAVDAPWSIGARASSSPTGETRFYVGLIDDVRVYARALSAAEIAALARR